MAGISNERDESESPTEGSERRPDFVQEAQACVHAFENDKPEWVAIDTETTGTTFFDEAFCATFAWPTEGGYFGGYCEITEPAGAIAAAWVVNHAETLVFHNAKFDLQKLILGELITRLSVGKRTIHDTEAIAHLLDENRDKGLKALAVAELGIDDTITVPLKSDPERSREVSREKYDLDTERRRVGKELGKNMSEVGYHELDREVLMPYAKQDAIFTARLFDQLYPRLLAKDANLVELYEREMELSLVLLDVEQKGIAVDTSYLEETSREVARQIFLVERQILQLTKREEFVNHHEWIKSAMAERGVVLEDTQKKTLEAVEDELCEAIVEFRRLSKLHSTYLQGMLQEQRDGILHPWFRQHGTRTGRMSSGGYVGD